MTGSASSPPLAAFTSSSSSTSLTTRLRMMTSKFLPLLQQEQSSWRGHLDSSLLLFFNRGALRSNGTGEKKAFFCVAPRGQGNKKDSKHGTASKLLVRTNCCSKMKWKESQRFEWNPSNFSIFLPIVLWYIYIYIYVCLLVLSMMVYAHLKEWVEIKIER